MPANDRMSTPSFSKPHAKRLRIIGVVVLAVGMTAAGLTYWIKTRHSSPVDISMLGFNRAERQQMGELYGKSGLLMEDGMEDLKQPSTQAMLIAAASVLAAWICFYLARLAEADDPSAGGTHQPHS